MFYVSLIFKKPTIFLTLVLLMLIDSSCVVGIPFLWGKATESVFNKDSYHFLAILLIYAGIKILKEINALITLKLEGIYYFEISKKLREYIYKTIIKMEPREVFLRSHSYLSLFLNDATLVRRGYESLNAIINTIMVITATLGIMLWLSPLFSLSVISILLFFLLLPILFRNKSRKFGKEYVKSNQKNVGVIRNILEGYRVFRLNRGEGYALAYNQVVKASSKTVVGSFLKLITLNLSTSFLANFPNIFSLILASISVYYGYIDIATFITINVYINNLSSTIYLATHHINLIVNGGTALKKIRDLEVNYIQEDIERLTSSLELRDISISFKEKNIINNLTLSIKPKKKYLLVGKSGSGKSSLTQVILGLLKPTTGKVFWNKQDLARIDPRKLLKYVNMISTSDSILEATLKENITMFDDVSEEDLDKVINLLGISHLDKNKVINSSLVSAGEMQRILLARALIKPRDILILDEGLANLDQKNRERIEKHLLANKDLTLIHITHQRLYLDLYDEVIDLDLLTRGRRDV